MCPGCCVLCQWPDQYHGTCTWELKPPLERRGVRTCLDNSNIRPKRPQHPHPPIWPRRRAHRGNSICCPNRYRSACPTWAKLDVASLRLRVIVIVVNRNRTDCLVYGRLFRTLAKFSQIFLQNLDSFFVFFFPCTFLRLRHQRRSDAHLGMLHAACSAGPLPACRDGELPAHVSEDFVQLGRFPSDVALLGKRELQE